MYSVIFLGVIAIMSGRQCSEKHRVIQLEGPLEVIWASPCSELVLLDQVAEGCVQLSYGWRATASLGSLFQCLTTLVGKSVFPRV